MSSLSFPGSIDGLERLSWREHAVSPAGAGRTFSAALAAWLSAADCSKAQSVSDRAVKTQPINIEFKDFLLVHLLEDGRNSTILQANFLRQVLFWKMILYSRVGLIKS